MSKKKSTNNMAVFKRILKYMRPYRLAFYSAVILTLLGLISVVRPAIIGELVNAYIQETSSVIKDWTDANVSSDPKTGFRFWVIVMVGILFFEGIVQFLRTYISTWLGQSIIRDLRAKTYRKITSFRLSYFDKNPIGALVTRVVSDIEAIADIFSQGIITLTADLLRILMILIFMFTINWELSLLVLVPLPIMFIATKIFAKAMKKAFQQERTMVNKINTFVQEHITGMSIVQIFNREKIEKEKFKELNADHRAAHIKAVWAFSIFLPFVEFLSSLAIAIVIVYSLYTIDPSNLDKNSVGEIFMFVMWISQLFRPIRQLADKFNVLQRGMVRAERVFKVLDEDALVQDEGTIVPEAIRGDIDFKDVHFAYNEPEYVLNGIDFHVKAGETIAFVGATGAGKSTIISLLSRFYEHQKGDILVDGHRIEDYELESLRQHIALVPQDVFLFSDTIHNNISLKNSEITREEIVEASKVIGAHDFITQLPEGYDFNVRERGGMLSVGQRQLLSFIRAYVYNPSVLILDEATSSIDTESEILIQEATKKLTKGRTSVIIAHRLATIQNADRIYVMEAGKIIEEGTHQSLLEQDGHYAHLFNLQFAK